MTDQETIDQATRIMASTPPANLIQALADAGLLTSGFEVFTDTDGQRSIRRKADRAEKAEVERDALRTKLSDTELLLTDLGKTFTRVHAERDALAATVRRVRELAEVQAQTCRNQCRADIAYNWQLVLDTLDDPQEQP